MGFLLNIIASIIKWALQPICFFVGLITCTFVGGFNRWQFDLALTKDAWGNVLIKHTANLLLIKKNSKYKFGQPFDTISYVLGINKKENTLTKIGSLVAWILNIIDENHVENAIENKL